MLKEFVPCIDKVVNQSIYPYEGVGVGLGWAMRARVEILRCLVRLNTYRMAVNLLATQGVNQLAQGKLYLKLNIFLTDTSENRGQQNITEFNKFI